MATDLRTAREGIETSLVIRELSKHLREKVTNERQDSNPRLLVNNKTPCTGNTHYQRKSKNEISQMQTTELSVLWTPYQQRLQRVI